MAEKDLFDKVKPLGYYRAVSRKGGVMSAIALAGVFFILHYIFDNYIYGNVLETIASMETVFYVLAGVIGVAALGYAISAVWSRKVKGLDTALLVLVFADIMVIIQKLIVDKNVLNKMQPLFYYIPLAVAVVLTVIRWFRYKPEFNRIVDTKPMPTAGFKTYYKLMFSRPSTYAAAVVTAVVMVAFIVTEKKGWFGFTAVNTAASQKMYQILTVGAVIAAVFYIASLVARLVYKNVDFCDTIAMNTVVIAIAMLVRLAFAHAVADIVVAIVLVVCAVAMQVILALRTVDVRKVLYIEEGAEEREEAEKEAKKAKKDDAVIAVIPPAAVAAEPADLSELERRVTETERVGGFLMRNAERTMSLIDEERSLRERRVVTVVESAPHAAESDREAFLMRKAEQLESKVEYLMTELNALKARVAELEARPVAVVAQPEPQPQPEEAAEEGYEEFERERESVNWIETEAKTRRAKPRYTFDLKLRLADENVKGFYSDIKNALLSYGMHSRMSRHKENFNKGRNQIARMAINGKTLKVYLAIDPNTLDPKIYHHKDVSDKKGVADLPTMINVRSGLAVRKIKALIDRIAEELVIKPKKYEPVDFAKDLTLDGFTTVERKGYGYMVKDAATRAQADEIPDDFATNAVEYIYAEKRAERFIKTKVTLDQLEDKFEDGATIDIDAIRDKGLASAPNSNWLSVAASDRLGKKFHVYANEYTVSAAKMICVAGGEAYMILQPEN